MLLAIWFASPLVAATRSVTVVVPPPRSFATWLRCTPGFDVVCGLVALPVTAFLLFGSQPRTLTVWTCWTPDIRGRNEIMLSCQRSTTAEPPAPPALRKISLVSSTTTS